ncbi:hypothetical protein NLU13_5053 [Sarocladium strictum]|uniref:DUF2157 domain-containing protein n=1 Tax=Sarocladium strictum TaxID=5046 RepID=A0AA39GK16_SARSR|nr:hypothetical protein NLU13_5053 [Sarocladium strictum]
MARTQKTLELGARHAQVVQSAIRHWLESEALSESQATLLADTIHVRAFDWDKFAKYTLRLAVVCLVIAVSSVVLQASFMRLLRRVVALPAAVRGGVTGLVGVGVHVLAYDRSQTRPEQKYANEGVHAVGALFFALAALQVVEQLNDWHAGKVQRDGTGTAQPKAEVEEDQAARERRKQEEKERRRLMGNAIWAVVFGLGVVYATVALLSKSNLIWTCAIMVFSSCVGGSGGYFGGGYWIDMESPFLFIGFGSFLVGIARAMQSYTLTEPLWSTTRTWGLLYSFVSLWILSIWGYDDYFEKVSDSRSPSSRRLRMFFWSVVFFIAAGFSTWHGLRFDDSTTKGFGLTFLGINLYTKYFEYFWGWSKPIFFAILAASFAAVGKYAENVWNMRVEELGLNQS